LAARALCTSSCRAPQNALVRGGLKQLSGIVIVRSFPVACWMAVSSRAALAWSRPVTVSWRLTGIPSAMLADSWRMRRSPLEQGSSPAGRAHSRGKSGVHWAYIIASTRVPEVLAGRLRLDQIPPDQDKPLTDDLVQLIEGFMNSSTHTGRVPDRREK
jgi:hypothetical protein